jgi:hypothetical protein
VIDHLAIRRAPESLIRYGRDVEARLDQHHGRAAAEVLVELQLHASFATGMST